MSPTSTTSALPSLPLPSDAKRIVTRRRAGRAISAGRAAARGSCSLACVRSGLPVGSCTLTVLCGAVSTTLIRYCSGLSFSSVFQNVSSLDRKPFSRSFLRHVGVGIGEADEIDAGRAIAIDDGEAGAVERQADAAPRAIERIVDDELRHAVAALLEARMTGAAAAARRRRGRDRLRFRRAEADHQPRQHLRFEIRIRRHHRPRECRRAANCRSSPSAPAPCRDATRRSRRCPARCRARCACGTCRACTSNRTRRCTCRCTCAARPAESRRGFRPSRFP